MSFTEQEALPIGAIDVTVTFGSSECNITAAVMLKSSYPFVLSKGLVDLPAQPDFSYKEGKFVILPPGSNNLTNPFHQKGPKPTVVRLSTIPESPEEENEDSPHRGRLSRRNTRLPPTIRDNAPIRPRSIALLVSKDVEMPPPIPSRGFPVNSRLTNQEISSCNH